MKNQKVQVLASLGAAEVLARSASQGLNDAHNTIAGDRLDATEPRLASIREKLRAARRALDIAYTEMREVLLPLTQESFTGVDKSGE